VDILGREAEVQDVAVMHDVLLAFEAQLARVAGASSERRLPLVLKLIPACFYRNRLLQTEIRDGGL